MRRDPTAFRERFNAYKNGKSVSEIYGLPGYAGGTSSYLDDTINFLKEHEGFKDTTYTDGNGIPTIGYGFTDSALVKKGRISRAEADARLKKEILAREAFLSKMTNWDKLGEGAKTALRSYYYNYPAGFKDTTKFMQAWNAGNYAEAIRQVDAGWNDTKNPGLRTRREREQALLKADPFLMPAPQKPMSQTTAAELNAERQFQPWSNYHSTDYPINNPAPASVSSWNSPQSPAYTPSQYSGSNAYFKMPTVREAVEASMWKPGYKNGKLPGYYLGKNDEIEELIKSRQQQRSDNTIVSKQPVQYTVKRSFKNPVVAQNLVDEKQKQQPVIRQGKNYTQRRIEEETKRVPEEIYSALQGIGIGSDIVGKTFGLPPIYSSLKAAKEFSKGNVLSGVMWSLPFIAEAKPAITAEIGPWWNAKKTWGKNFKFNNDSYYRSVNLDKGDMPVSAIEDANSIGIIRSLNKNFEGRPYFSVGQYENTSFPQASRSNAIIEADPSLHEFVSVGDFSHSIQPNVKILPGETVMPVIKTPQATFPGGDLRSGAFSYWTPESLLGMKYWRNRSFTPNLNSPQLRYIDALQSQDINTAQRIINETYAQKAGNGIILNTEGQPENMVHTVGDSYKPGFREFDPNIEGQNSFIYTTDAAGRPMSSSYSSYYFTENEAKTGALKRFNAYMKDTKRNIESLQERINDSNTPDVLRKSYQRTLDRLNDEYNNKRMDIYNNFLAENLKKVDPSRQIRLYGKLENPIIVDAEGAGWNKFLGPDAWGGKTEMSTRELEQLIQTANDVGFGTNLGAKPGIIDGAIIKNVVDYGGKKITDPLMTPHTVFEFSIPNQLKLSQPVTYTKDGLGVWPWQRFDWSKADMHFANGKSPIYIKPAKRGSFTAAAKRRGMTVSQLESAVLKNPSKYSKAMRKKAQFSRNTRSWKK